MADVIRYMEQLAEKKGRNGKDAVLKEQIPLEKGWPETEAERPEDGEDGNNLR